MGKLVSSVVPSDKFGVLPKGFGFGASARLLADIHPQHPVAN